MYFTSVRDPVVGVVSVVGSPCSGPRARRRLQTLRYQSRARRRLQTYATSRALGAGYKPTLPVGCKAQVTNLRYQSRCKAQVTNLRYQSRCKAQVVNLRYRSGARRR